MKNTTLSLTVNEIAFLRLARNYTDLESQQSDNYSNAGLEEARDLFDDNKHAAAALIGSLEKKGLGGLDSEFGIFWLNRDKLPEIFEAIKE